MQVPQKVKNFIWRACRNAMPTKHALMKRTVIADSICERCRDEAKDPLHALWSCTELDIVWADQALWSFRNAMGFVDFKDLVSWIVLEGKQLDIFAVTAWKIWSQRNQVRVQAPATTFHQIIAVSKTSLNEFHLKRQRIETQV